MALWMPHVNMGVLIGMKFGSVGYDLCSLLVVSRVGGLVLGGSSRSNKGGKVCGDSGNGICWVVDSFAESVRWSIIGTSTLEADFGELLWQFPSLFSRQLEHLLSAFTQEQPLHMPVLLHLQQWQMQKIVKGGAR